MLQQGVLRMHQELTDHGPSRKNFRFSATQAAEGLQQMVYGLGFAIGGMLVGLVTAFLINQI